MHPTARARAHASRRTIPGGRGSGCWHAGSLHEVGYSEVANGALLDNIRRVVCFGFQLARLDIRQVPRE
jgi:hypothetical protein